jgi:hypothetical protein
MVTTAIKDAPLAPDGEEQGRLNVRHGVRDFLVGDAKGSVFVWLDKIIASASHPDRAASSNCRGMYDEAMRMRSALTGLIRPAPIYVPVHQP